MEGKLPNPGSPEALEAGCRCPVMDNHYGKGCGMKDDDGNPVFWRSQDCPLHGWPEEKDKVDAQDIH